MTVYVTFAGQPRPWVQALLASLGQTLAAHGGTAGILRDRAPAPLNSWPGRAKNLNWARVRAYGQASVARRPV